MRVITGSLKGRRIQAVRGDYTRPTTDKIKESIYNILGQYFDGGCVLDLFAGSGNLGIEAISRGMSHAVFIDHNIFAIKTIKNNLIHLEIVDKAEVYQYDAFKALHLLAKKQDTFDLIFLDPPYKKTVLSELLDIIITKGLLNHKGRVVCEFGVGINVVYDEKILKILRCQNYGTTQILILEKVATNNE